MDVYQHVYGRARLGYKSFDQGYQLAALSEALEEQEELIDKLNWFSFFTLKNQLGKTTRYSFFSPIEGYYAIGASQYAKDLTGNIGSFGHNYVFSEKAYLSSGLTPIDILCHFLNEKKPVQTAENSGFFNEEADLREIKDRILPKREIHPESRPVNPEKWRRLALNLLDIYLGESTLIVPMVIASEKDTWEILAELYSLLPHQEAMGLHFSTFFAKANDFLEGFRLVFIPDESFIPDALAYYQVFSASDSIEAIENSRSFTRFWIEHPSEGKKLIHFINLLRHDSNFRQKAVPLYDELLRTGQIFRQCMEQLEVTQIFELVLQDPQRLVDYYRMGQEISFSEIAEVVWREPELFLLPVLQAAKQLGGSGLEKGALAGTVKRAIEKPNEGLPEIIHSLQQSGYDQAFYAHPILQNTHFSQLLPLATHLRRGEHYRQSVHQLIAEKVIDQLSELGEVNALKMAGWFRNEIEELEQANLFIRMTFDLLNGFRKEPEGHYFTNFNITDYELSETAYDLVLVSALRISTHPMFLLSPETVVQQFFQKDFLSSFLSHYFNYIPRKDGSIHKQWFLTTCLLIKNGWIKDETGYLNIVQAVFRHLGEKLSLASPNEMVKYFHIKNYRKAFLAGLRNLFFKYELEGQKEWLTALCALSLDERSLGNIIQLIASTEEYWKLAKHFSVQLEKTGQGYLPEMIQEQLYELQRPPEDAKSKITRLFKKIFTSKNK